MFYLFYDLGGEGGGEYNNLSRKTSSNITSIPISRAKLNIFSCFMNWERGRSKNIYLLESVINILEPAIDKFR